MKIPRKALSKYDRMEAVELEKEIDYGKFLELNKKRHDQAFH